MDSMVNPAPHGLWPSGKADGSLEAGHFKKPKFLSVPQKLQQIPAEDDDYTPREEEAGEEPWEYAKDPTYQERDDLFTDRHAFVLTRGNVYGTELIYDLIKGIFLAQRSRLLRKNVFSNTQITGTLTAWNPFSESDFWTDQPAYSMISVYNPLNIRINYILTL